MVAAIGTIEIFTLSHHTEDTYYLLNVNTGYRNILNAIQKKTRPTTHHIFNP